jgi:hypothetical protein
MLLSRVQAEVPEAACFHVSEFVAVQVLSWLLVLCSGLFWADATYFLCFGSKDYLSEADGLHGR